MRGKRGIAWLAAIILGVGLIWAPGLAAAGWDKGEHLSFTLAAAQTPLEAQMLGERPWQSRPALSDPNAALLSDLASGLPMDQEGATGLKLFHNLEMHISVRYERDGLLDPRKRSESQLMSSALDYRLLPNLRVGLNAYLYRPEPADNFSLMRPFGRPVMGWGPGIKYDLGNWSFLVKSQVEQGNREQAGSDMQHWFRVWYAF